MKKKHPITSYYHPLLLTIKNSIISLLLTVLLPTFSIATTASKPYAKAVFSSFHVLSPSVRDKAYIAYLWAISHYSIPNKDIFTIVDFSLPSNKKRLWVLDLKHKKVLMNLLVAQGKYSGTQYATHFSNKVGSRKSCLGIFLTRSIYLGKHGISERLEGLEKSINDQAWERNIVIHGAYYVSQFFIHKTGRIGRSWGCFAVNPKQLDSFIRYIRGGSLLFAYSDYMKTTYLP